MCVLIPGVNRYGCGEAHGAITICSKWCVAGGRHLSMYKMLQLRRTERVPAPEAVGRQRVRSSSGSCRIPILPGARARRLPRAARPCPLKLLAGERGGTGAGVPAPASPDPQPRWGNTEGFAPSWLGQRRGAGPPAIPPGKRPAAGLCHQS